MRKKKKQVHLRNILNENTIYEAYTYRLKDIIPDKDSILGEIKKLENITTIIKN
jgi:hypothetical protein